MRAYVALCHPISHNAHREDYLRMSKSKLSETQRTIVYGWLAQGLPYPELKRRMLASFGVAVSSPACSDFRKRKQQEIGALQQEMQAADIKRKHDRERKAMQRSGHVQRHCSTCTCSNSAA